MKANTIAHLREHSACSQIPTPDISPNLKYWDGSLPAHMKEWTNLKLDELTFGSLNYAHQRYGNLTRFECEDWTWYAEA